MQSTEPMVVDKVYELIKWMLPHVGRFPRSFRYTLGNRLEERLYDLLEELQLARYAPVERKGGHLESSNSRLQVIRLLVRMSFEMRFLPTGSYEYAAAGIEEVGRMIGGWQKHVSARKPL